MIPAKTFFVIYFVVATAPQGEAQEQSSYCAFTPFHTLCRFKGIGSRCGGRVPSRGVDPQDATLIVGEHNRLRALVAKGLEGQGNPGPQPPAANMRALEWDNELAAIAQRHADQCIFEHDCNDCRKVARFGVGQNLFIAFQSNFDSRSEWPTAIKGWYDEVKAFDPDFISPFRFSGSVGHYTQLLWAETRRVGCGFTMFFEGGWWKKLYTCNYGPAGNFLARDMYREGSPCSECPSGTTCSLIHPGLCEDIDSGISNLVTPDRLPTPSITPPFFSDATTARDTFVILNDEADDDDGDDDLEVALPPSRQSDIQSIMELFLNMNRHNLQPPGGAEDLQPPGGTGVGLPRQENATFAILPTDLLFGSNFLPPQMNGIPLFSIQRPFVPLSLRNFLPANGTLPTGLIIPMGPRFTEPLTVPPKQFTAQPSPSSSSSFATPQSKPTKTTLPLADSLLAAMLSTAFAQKAEGTTPASPTSKTSKATKSFQPVIPVTTFNPPLPFKLPKASQSPATPRLNEENFIKVNGGFQPPPALLPFLTKVGVNTQVIRTNSLQNVQSIIDTLPEGTRPLVLFRANTGELQEVDLATLMPSSSSSSSSSHQAPRGKSIRPEQPDFLLQCDLDRAPCKVTAFGGNWTMMHNADNDAYLETLVDPGRGSQLVIQEVVSRPQSGAVCINLIHRSGAKDVHLMPQLQVGIWPLGRQVIQETLDGSPGVWQMSKLAIAPVRTGFLLVLNVGPNRNAVPVPVAFDKLTVEDGICV